MFDILISLIESVILGLFLYSFSTDQKRSSIKSAVYIAAAFMLTLFFNQTKLNEQISAILFICLNMVFLYTINDYEILQNFTIALLPQIIVSAVNLLFYAILTFFLYHQFDVIRLQEEWYHACEVSMLILHAAAFHLTVNFLRKDRTSVILPQKDLVILSIIMIILYIMFNNIYSLLFPDLFQTFNISITILCLFTLAILILLLYEDLINKNLKEARQNFEIEMLSAESESNRKLMKAQDELYQLRHDLKHFIQLLPDKTMDNEELANMVESYKEDFSLIYIPISSNSKIINYIINLKRDEALRKGLDFQCIINISDEIPMHEDDLCLLLSNLLDNAITHIGSEMSIIFEITDKHETLFIRISNSIDAPVLDDSHEFINCKKAEGHGFGLVSVRQIVRKYNGDLYYDQNESVFVVTVMIPLFSLYASQNHQQTTL